MTPEEKALSLYEFFLKRESSVWPENQDHAIEKADKVIQTVINALYKGDIEYWMKVDEHLNKIYNGLI